MLQNKKEKGGINLLHIGTSGYSYKDWIGPFYPEGTKQGDMLSIYSNTFSFTEINSTYYKIPNPYLFFNMQKKTCDNFIFTVKLHQSMTHSRDASGKDYSDFTDALNVLKDVDKLGCIVAQFPYSFHNIPENKDYLLKLKERFLGFDIVVEFRNNRWLSEDVFQMLRNNELGYICVDEPGISGLLDKRAASTSHTAYLRFHGRNSSKWYNHNESYERYDYCYSENELKEWADKIKQLESNSKNCFVSFNNHFKAQAVLNGMMLRSMLAD